MERRPRSFTERPPRSLFVQHPRALSELQPRSPTEQRAPHTVGAAPSPANGLMASLVRRKAAMRQSRSRMALIPHSSTELPPGVHRLLLAWATASWRAPPPPRCTAPTQLAALPGHHLLSAVYTCAHRGRASEDKSLLAPLVPRRHSPQPFLRKFYPTTGWLLGPGPGRSRSAQPARGTTKLHS